MGRHTRTDLACAIVLIMLNHFFDNPALGKRSAQHVPWPWALAGALAGLALTLLVFAPAQWLGLAVSNLTHGHMQLIQVRGTLWSGSARLMLSSGLATAGMTLPGRLDWQLRPGWLAMNLQLRADCCTTQSLQVIFSGLYGRANVAISDGISVWPASVLNGLGAPWNTLRANGSLQLSTHGLSLQWLDGQVVLTGRAVLDAMAISSPLSTLKPMGSYRVALTGGETPTIDLITLEGGLQLSGRGNLTKAGLRFEGVANATDEHQAALSNLLNIIGRRTGARSFIKLG